MFFCQWEIKISQIWQKLRKSYWIWTYKNRNKLTANPDTIINNVHHLSNFLNSGKTWINIKDMYLHTCLHTSVLISFILTIWWDGVSFFKIQNKLQVTQNHLDFCTKCKQTFRVVDETLEFDCLSNKRRWRSNCYSR